MIELSEQLASVETRNPAPTGTKRIKYSPASEGPFACQVCCWYLAKPPEQADDPMRLANPPRGRCEHPEALLDEEIPWADAAHTAKTVDQFGCCEEERKKVVQSVEISSLLSELKPRRIVWQGIPVDIEFEAGEMRYGKKLPAAYGEIVGVRGLDGMALDCFVRSDISESVFIVRMKTFKANEQEDKSFLGFDSLIEAVRAFTEYYGEEQYISTREMKLFDFKQWVFILGAKIMASDAKGKPLRDTASAFWDSPVHSNESHVDFRSIQAATIQHEQLLAKRLSGGLRVKVTRELARQAVGQLVRGKRAHELTFTAPADIRKLATPAIGSAYIAACDEAIKEANRMEAAQAPIELQEGDVKRKQTQDDAMLALLILLEDRYINFIGAALREGTTSEFEEIMIELQDGDIGGVETRLEAFVNKYSAGKLDSIASQVVREAGRQGRGDTFALDPRVANSGWFRSALLDEHCCDACTKLDMKPIPGPDYDLSLACEGGDNCRCLPVTVVSDVKR